MTMTPGQVSEKLKCGKTVVSTLFQFGLLDDISPSRFDKGRHHRRVDSKQLNLLVKCWTPGVILTAARAQELKKVMAQRAGVPNGNGHTVGLLPPVAPVVPPPPPPAVEPLNGKGPFARLESKLDALDVKVDVTVAELTEMFNARIAELAAGIDKLVRIWQS